MEAINPLLGSVISQKGKTIAFNSSKANSAVYYTNIELELLSAINPLKEFRNIPLGH